MDIKGQLFTDLSKIVKKITPDEIEIELTKPPIESHGDYSTNVSLILAKKLGKNPIEVAEEIASSVQSSASSYVEKVEAVKPGFINFWVSKKYLFANLNLLQRSDLGIKSDLNGKRIMVEYAHPNTHKEMHIGHMRTLITGEALSRIFTAAGATVFRANYQGDIGPHVAKALFGVTKLLDEKGLTLDEIEKWSNRDKAHFLGEAYVRGNQEYEAHKGEIDSINAIIYSSSPSTSLRVNSSREVLDSASLHSNNKDVVVALYKITRRWSLEYYDEFYKRFYTKFDHLFFESEMAGPGKEIVKKNLGKVFKEDQGAIVFPGEQHGLHTRVFITSAGNPTYEGKEMANAMAEYEAFPFDLKVHVVGSEQAGYFQVVFKALELIDPAKFKDKQHHLPMGMVHFSDRKMSSRTGDIVRVDWLIDEVKKKVLALIAEGKIESGEKAETAEAITIGAIKYSMLKNGPKQDVAFDIEKSVTLDGDSGPYIQYTYARTQSVLAKSKIKDLPAGRQSQKSKIQLKTQNLEKEELEVLRSLIHYNEVVWEAAHKFSPNLVCNYLHHLAQKFNLFYQNHKIIGSKSEEFRLSLTTAVSKTLQYGLSLLGIKVVEKM